MFHLLVKLDHYFMCTIYCLLSRANNEMKILPPSTACQRIVHCCMRLHLYWSYSFHHVALQPYHHYSQTVCVNDVNTAVFFRLLLKHVMLDGPHSLTSTLFAQIAHWTFHIQPVFNIVVEGDCWIVPQHFPPLHQSYYRKKTSTHLTHSYLLNKEQSPNSDHCRSPSTVEHVLTSCSAYKNIREKYYHHAWLSRILTNISKQHIFNCLSELNIFSKL